MLVLGSASAFRAESSAMSEPDDPISQNPPDAQPDDDLPSSEEFERWLKADPANAAEFYAILKRTALGEFGDLTPKVRASAQAAIGKREEHRCIEIVSNKMKALMEVMSRPPGTMRAQERLDQCNALADEVTDALLETPEPHRTRFLKVLLPLREQLRALRISD